MAYMEEELKRIHGQRQAENGILTDRQRADQQAGRGGEMWTDRDYSEVTIIVLT